MIFLAHAESEKPFVEQVKDALVTLARSPRVQAAVDGTGEQERREPVVFYDKDDFSPDRAASLASFTECAARARTLLIFVPKAGFHQHSFVAKELLAFMTGILHASRLDPDPTQLTDQQRARAADRLQRVLIVDRHCSVEWPPDGTGPTALPPICRSGSLRDAFVTELPRLREQSATPTDVATAALARFWGVRRRACGHVLLLGGALSTSSCWPQQPL